MFVYIGCLSASELSTCLFLQQAAASQHTFSHFLSPRLWQSVTLWLSLAGRTTLSSELLTLLAFPGCSSARQETVFRDQLYEPSRLSLLTSIGGRIRPLSNHASSPDSPLAVFGHRRQLTPPKSAARTVISSAAKLRPLSLVSVPVSWVQHKQNEMQTNDAHCCMETSH